MYKNKVILNIIIGGDTCPIGRNEKLFIQGDARSLLNDLMCEFELADFAIVNLECPLVNESSPIEKVGPNLRAPVACVEGLRAMRIAVVGLANNHIMDHGINGLQSTIKALDKHGIAHVGAGESIDEARMIHVREVNGIRIGILAVTEHEFGIASRCRAGANPLDIIDFVRNINENRSRYDVLIVLVHGGNEHYIYPRPGLINTCRFLVEQGASAVICQHSHCVGCIETYLGSPIIYGQGNFLFDMPSPFSSWHIGCLVRLSIDSQGCCDASLVPIHQAEKKPGAHLMPLNKKNHFLKTLDVRSSHLANPQAIEEKWKAFCRDNKRFYLHTLHGNPSFFRRLVGKLDFLHYLDRPAKQRARLNIVQCESHQEALKTILEEEIFRKIPEKSKRNGS